MSSLAAQRRAHRAASSEEVGLAGRAGLVARGVVYAIIGLLALKLAVGDGGKATNQQGAMRTVAKQPFGQGLLIALAVGLAGYAVWRLSPAPFGHRREETDSGCDRIARLPTTISYCVLCFTAIEILA